MSATGLKALFSRVEPEAVPWAGASLRVGPLDLLDRVSLGAIALVFLILLVNIGRLQPAMTDTWYHVNVAQQHLAEGGIAGWDNWDYAPFGRPHLYPPLLHLILAGLAVITGGVIHASQLCAVIFLPLALLTTWFAARRLMNSTVALLAVALLLTDPRHPTMMEAHIAGCLINILLPLLLVSFLARRAWWSIALLTLLFYSHLGFPLCTAAGLLLFGLKYRGYGRLALKVVTVSALFFSPWLVHVLSRLDWLPRLVHFGMPGSMFEKLLSLQSFNLLLLGLGIWGALIASRRQAQRMLPVCMLIAFLPILFAYGGRYTMHTLPLWAMLGATVITPLLPRPHTLRRAVGVMLLTLMPWPSINVVHGVEVLPLTTPHALAILTVMGRVSVHGDHQTESYQPDCDQLADWLRGHTDPEEIIHTNAVYMAEMIALLAQRRTDLGAWPECGKRRNRIAAKAMRDFQPRAVFACLKPAADGRRAFWELAPMPGVDRTFDLGRYRIGLRDPHWLARTGVAVTGWRAAPAAGAAGSLQATGQAPRWTFPARLNQPASIVADAPAGTFGGAKLRLVSNVVCDDLIFGLRTADGRDYRWPLALATPGRPDNVRVIFDWMLDATQQRWPGGAVSQVYFAYSPDVLHRPGSADRTLEVMQMEFVAGGRTRDP